jgi:hypothetical protein
MCYILAQQSSKKRKEVELEGRILAYSKSNKTGVVAGRDGARYTFDKSDWMEQHEPQKGDVVDFLPQGERGTNIYLKELKETSSVHNQQILMGLVAVGLTFFLGFIGTFITRLVMAGQNAMGALVATLIHFILSLVLVIPVIGIFLFLGVQIYYMVANYKLVMRHQKKLSQSSQ